MRDHATLPDNGVIYEGDYYKAIPYHEYIHEQELPDDAGIKIFDIRDFGAVPDGITVNTDAINKATLEAKNAGGGIVLVDGGRYVSGTIRVYDNTTLWITRDSALVASKNHDNYVDAFVILDNAENVRITGGGKIFGNGEYFVYLPNKRPRLEPLDKIKLPPILYDPMGYPVDTMRYEIRCRIRYAMDKYGDGLPKIQRPMYMVWVNCCKEVQIDNVILEDAMDWNLCIDGSDNVRVKDIVIDGNRHVANTDGIDVMGSENVDVRHCFISCADDGMVVKAPRGHEHDGIDAQGAGKTRGTKHVHFEDCTVITVANGFKVGTETYHDISDVTVENCRIMLPDIYPGSCSGISIESSDGSDVSDIHVKNITMENVACPLFICLNKRVKFGIDEERGSQQGKYFGGSIDNVTIENISVVDAEVPSIVTGYRMPVRDVPSEISVESTAAQVIEDKEKELVGKNLGRISIDNFHVKYRDDKEDITLLPEIHESVTDYPENSAFGDVPAYGIYIRHADDVTLNDVEITPRSMNTRKCIVRE